MRTNYKVINSTRQAIIIIFTGMDRIISDTNIRSILNFRDAGGLMTAGGCAMRKGLIYRSANPDRVNGRDIKKLKELRVKTIADLRDPSEFSSGKAEIPGIKIINIPLNFESVTRQRLRPLIKRNYDPEGINRALTGIYVEIVDAVRPVLSTIAAMILEPDNTPLLIHCQAGKDRTGILIALLQMIADADREEIIRDYLASNDSLMPLFERKLKIRKYITLGFFPAEAVLHAVKQKREDIITVIERVGNNYGGIKEYLSGAGFEISQINKLRDILTEK